jgi:hypothetical protein
VFVVGSDLPLTRTSLPSKDVWRIAVMEFECPESKRRGIAKLSENSQIQICPDLLHVATDEFPTIAEHVML